MTPAERADKEHELDTLRGVLVDYECLDHEDLEDPGIIDAMQGLRESIAELDRELGLRPGQDSSARALSAPQTSRTVKPHQ